MDGGASELFADTICDADPDHDLAQTRRSGVVKDAGLAEELAARDGDCGAVMKHACRQEEKPSSRAGIATPSRLLALGAVLAAAAAIWLGLWAPNNSMAKLEKLARKQFSAPTKGLQAAPEEAPAEEVQFPQQDEMPETPVTFSLFYNGADTKSKGIESSSELWQGLDEMIRTLCPEVPEAQEVAHENNATLRRICEPLTGARVFSETGLRIHSFVQVVDQSRLYLVPQGQHFVFPLFEVGNEIFPAVRSPIPGKPIKLTQLSMSPRVFQVENFITPEEIQSILDHNEDLVKPSEVGFSGWRDGTRTSSTAWDFHSWAARRVRRRAFDLARMEFDNEMGDALQVLRYGPGEWYKPHTDWFDESGYDGHDPTVNNGTNRFATVFVYLTSVEEGGHTVFPLSKSHKGYNGEQIVHPGTERTAGYIAQNDAEWACNTSSTALRSPTYAGGALLFYNQGPDSALDKFSLHGGCPVIKGVKWSANVWLWNRPKPGKEKAKDQRPAPDHHSIQVQFHNNLPEPVNLFWDDGTEEMVFQSEILPGEFSPMTTYHGHRFLVRSTTTNETLHEFVAHDKYKGQGFVAEIGGAAPLPDA